VKNALSDFTCPLVPMQLGMLFQYLSNRNSGEYVQQVVIDLNENIDAIIFREAIRRIIMRYDVFRIGFSWEKGDEPTQCVQNEVEIRFKEVDLSLCSFEMQELEIKNYLICDRREGFDLSSPPLCRFVLFRLGKQKVKLVWTYHHIILDGRSRVIVSKEIFSIYEALYTGSNINLDEVVSYLDYIKWLGMQDYSSGISYWKNLLQGNISPGSLRLFMNPDSPVVETSQVGTHELRIDRITTSKLHKISHENKISISNIAQAAWAIILGRYSNEDTILFGTVRSCRKTPFNGIERLVGLVMNNLPIVVDMKEEIKLSALLKKIREQQLYQRKFDLTPLDEIQRKAKSLLNYNLFQTYMVFDFNETITFLRTSDKKWLERDYRLIEKSNYPLHLSVFAEDELLVRYFYHPDKFNNKAIHQISTHYEALIRDIAGSEDKYVFSYKIIPDDEEHKILEDWNSTEKDYDLNQTLMSLFEKQVDNTPNDVALIGGDVELTYQKLNERANRLGRYLSRFGVGPEVLVGLYMERSVEMVVGIYGVLKAGGAYVPLDPEYPRERLEFMLEDTQVPVILSQKHLATRIPQTKAQVVYLDSGWDEIGREEGVNFRNGTVASNSAYVIFTSGSTGKPKGVVNEHRGIVNRLIWMQDEYQLKKDDLVLQKTPFGFDVSVWEFFWPLQVGAKLIVAKPGGHKDSSYLKNLVRRLRITTLHFVPSMLQIFLEEKGLDECDSIKRVICSGEAMTYELQRRFFERFGKSELHNLYGPTEAAVDVTYWSCKRDSERLVVPIGRPVANTQIYILDRHMQPVAVGVTGELYIGGVQVARGYLKRPELTEERFVSNPFRAAEKGAKLYRTGDLARYLPDGAIEYLGRVDFQVKIRGLRVELGEIEAIMEEHESVGRCTVTLREDSPGDKRLVAYYVRRSGKELPNASFRGWLLEKMPDYMVPQHFVEVVQMPLTASGKVDRRALPKPELINSADKMYMAPRNRVEGLIAGVWKELLEVEQVGAQDNFFDLGGHSLHIIRMIGHLKNHFAKQIGVVDIFQHPTVERLAGFLAGPMNKSDNTLGPKSLNQGSKQREALKKMRKRQQLRSN
jgi:amino acid adenylation domain-containing protein